MSKTVLFQTIHFSLSTQFSSIWSIDNTLSAATTPSQSGPGSDGNKGVLCIPQGSSITGTSPSDCLESYIQNTRWGILPLSREAVGVFCSPSRMGQRTLIFREEGFLLLCSKSVGIFYGPPPTRPEEKWAQPIYFAQCALHKLRPHF